MWQSNTAQTCPQDRSCRRAWVIFFCISFISQDFYLERSVQSQFACQHKIPRLTIVIWTMDTQGCSSIEAGTRAVLHCKMTLPRLSHTSGIIMVAGIGDLQFSSDVFQDMSYPMLIKMWEFSLLKKNIIWTFRLLHIGPLNSLNSIRKCANFLTTFEKIHFLLPS